MKFIKKSLWSVALFILLICAGITICAFNPALTQKMAGIVNKLGFGNGSTDTVVVAGEEGEADGLLSGLTGDVVILPSTDDSGQLLSGVTTSVPKAENYIVPKNESATAPSQVADMLGLEPVSEIGREIGDEAASALDRDLDIGKTGDDYSFDALFYPYYHMLTEDEQKLYRQIYANAWDLVTSFMPVVDMDVDRVKTVFEAVYNDHPELFWLETGYSCQYLKSGKCVEISLKYNRTVNDLEGAKEEFETVADEILAEAKELGSDYEKEKCIHDKLIDLAEYDTSASMSQSAYSALVNGKSVCAGYSRAFQYLLQRLGIPCYYCTGDSGGDHAWNIVGLSDGYYNVDVTWDDTKPATYDYFNKTDNDYESTHIRKGLSVNLPACRGTSYRNLATGIPGRQPVMSGESEGTEAEVPEETTDTTDLDETEEPVSYINEHPQKPLTIDPVKTSDPILTEEETTFGLEDYYADCLAQMSAVGAGEKQFVNVIPRALWDAVERSYSDGSYKAGYVNEGLEKLGMNNFAIQLQVQRVGDGYYRLYHNISTW